MDEGTGIIENITTQYATIKDAFVANNGELEREIKMIGQINDSFTIVHERISNIENLTGSLKDIEKLSTSLTELIENNN